MSALEEIERLKAEIAAQEKEEQKPIEEVEEEPLEEEKEVEKPEEEAEKPKEELDNAGYAKLRREAAAEKKRADNALKELEELRKAKQPVEEVSEPVALPPEVQTMLQEHRITQAEREFAIFENKVKKENPEYDAVASEYASALYQSFKVQNPRKTEVELNQMTKNAILIKASQYAIAGYENPVEEMFHEAKELGFTGKSRVEAKEEKLTPDLRKVAENRKRSSGMAAANGEKEGMLTKQAASQLSAYEFAKLPKAEQERLMRG